MYVHPFCYYGIDLFIIFSTANTKTKQKIINRIATFGAALALAELSDLLVDVMDIILHCVDHNHLKAKPLSEVFAPVCAFAQVSHCLQARRIAVGTK